MLLSRGWGKELRDGYYFINTIPACPAGRQAGS